MPSPLDSRPPPPPTATIERMAETSYGTVLVVDDEPTIVDVFGRYMERAGSETYEAADGLEALEPPNEAVPTWSCST